MANTTTAGKTASTARVVLTPTLEPEVKLSAKGQKAVRELRDAHNLEKQVAEVVKASREIILDELGSEQTKFGTNAKGQRLVKIHLVQPKTPTRYNTAELVAFLAKTQPEVLAMFRAEDATATVRVLTLN
jgi:hypothetical protein